MVIPVDLGAMRYGVVVESNLFNSVGSRLRRLCPATRAAVITDANVAQHHLPVIQRSLLAAGYAVETVVIPAGEMHKTLATVQSIYDQLLTARVERSTPVLALGGGVAGDIAGFVAATLLRGVPFVQVPTSLLAMVDASIGGKTGVNHSQGKNLIGAFYQPRAVFIDPEALQTLPAAELRNGLAECIKHDLIRDAHGFTDLEQNLDRAIQLDIEYLATLIAHNVEIKAQIVQADPMETGERALLNFGHTFGHAIERATNYSYRHGQCVALGMLSAATLSRMLSLLDDAAVARIRAVINKAGLPTGGLQVDPTQIVAAMSSDKKIQAGELRFVLLEGIGRAVVRSAIPPEQVRAAVESICT